MRASSVVKFEDAVLTLLGELRTRIEDPELKYRPRINAMLLPLLEELKNLEILNGENQPFAVPQIKFKATIEGEKIRLTISEPIITR